MAGVDTGDIVIDKNAPKFSKYKHDSQANPDKKPRTEAKAAQAVPVTASQTYGWREPYDNLTFGHNMTGMCKRTFFDAGHLS